MLLCKQECIPSKHKLINIVGSRGSSPDTALVKTTRKSSVFFRQTIIHRRYWNISGIRGFIRLKYASLCKSAANLVVNSFVYKEFIVRGSLSWIFQHLVYNGNGISSAKHIIPGWINHRSTDVFRDSGAVIVSFFYHYFWWKKTNHLLPVI